MSPPASASARDEYIIGTRVLAASSIVRARRETWSGSFRRSRACARQLRAASKAGSSWAASLIVKRRSWTLSLRAAASASWIWTRALGLSFRRPVLVGDGLSLDIAELLHRLTERIPRWLRCRRGGGREHADAGQGFLRLPRRMAGDAGDDEGEDNHGREAEEGAPVHQGMRTQPSIRRRAVR